MKVLILTVLIISVFSWSNVEAEYANEISEAANLLNSAKPTQALELLSKIPFTPDSGINIVVASLRGESYLSLKKYDSAISNYIEILAKEPSAWVLRNGLAKAYSESGKYREAYVELDKFLHDYSLKNSKSELQLGKCLLEKDKMYTKEKEMQYEKAIADIEKKIPES